MTTRTTIALVALTAALVACTPMQPTDGSQTMSSASSVTSSGAAMSSSISLGDRGMNTTTHSGTYINTQYGFSLNYPMHFEPLLPLPTPGTKASNMRIVDNTVEYDEQHALFSVGARDREVAGDFRMSVDVYPLDTYSFVNIYDDEYVYDSAKDTWSTRMGQTAFNAQSRTYKDIKMYLFGFGDAGYAVSTYAIPMPKKNVMVEVNLGGCMGCIEGTDGFEGQSQEWYDAASAHQEADTKLILESFKRVD